MAALYRQDGDDVTPAHRPELHPEPNRLALLVGAGLGRLHQLPIDEAIDPASLDPYQSLYARIEEKRSEGTIRPSELPEPYCRYEAERLVELAIAAPAGRIELGWAHGSPTTDQFLIAEGEFVGFTSPCRATVTDRHLDLAVAQMSVAASYGQEAVIGFYEAYGLPVDIVQLDRAILLTHLVNDQW